MVVIAARRDAAGARWRRRKFELIGQQHLVARAGFGVQVVDGVFPQLPAAGAWRPLGGSRAGGVMLSAVPACTSSGARNP